MNFCLSLPEFFVGTYVSTASVYASFILRVCCAESLIGITFVELIIAASSRCGFHFVRQPEIVCVAMNNYVRLRYTRRVEGAPLLLEKRKRNRTSIKFEATAIL